MAEDRLLQKRMRKRHFDVRPFPSQRLGRRGRALRDGLGFGFGFSVGGFAGGLALIVGGLATHNSEIVVLGVGATTFGGLGAMVWA